MTAETLADDGDRKYYFDAGIVGRRVQADGGNAAIGSRLASREMFEGTLTGKRMDQGEPPWRWLEIGLLTSKPAEFGDETVWCEESYIYVLDAPAERG